MSAGCRTTKKSKLWALLSGILGVVWGGLVFVAPTYVLPNIFSIVVFSIIFPVTTASSEMLEILQQTQMMFSYLVAFIWVMFIVARISHRYYKKTGEVPYWITKIFLLAASLGVIATLPVLLSYIPGLTGINDVTLQIGGMGSILIITGGVSGLLGLITGAGYLISLNRFDR